MKKWIALLGAIGCSLGFSVSCSKPGYEEHLAKELVGIWNSHDGGLLSFDNDSRVSLDGAALSENAVSGDTGAMVLANTANLSGKITYRTVRSESIEKELGESGWVIEISENGTDYVPKWMLVSVSDNELTVIDIAAWRVGNLMGKKPLHGVYQRLSEAAYPIDSAVDTGAPYTKLEVGAGTPFDTDRLKAALPTGRN